MKRPLNVAKGQAARAAAPRAAAAGLRSADERLYFLDWLRILAFGLLVLFHVGMLYVSWSFHVKSPHAGPAIEPLMRLTAPWRMSLLFLVSGAATAFMLARRRPSGALLRHRMARLLLPLLFGMLVVVPPQTYFELQERFGFGGGGVDFMRIYLGLPGARPGFCDARGCLVMPTWNHLWFLPYLASYTLLLWAAVRWWPRGVDRAAAWLDRRSAAVLLLGMFLWFTTSRLLLGRFPVTHALVDDPLAHAQYLPAFVLGALLACGSALWPRIEALRWPALLLALLGWCGVLVLQPGFWRVSAFSLEQAAALAAALGFARRHLNIDNPARRWLTDAVFPIYIVHQTLVIVIWAALRGAALPVGVEAALIVVGTFAGSLLVFVVVRRVRVLRPFFGLPWQRAASPS